MKSNKWRHVSDTIREHLRLPTHPVAIRMFEDEKDIPNEVEMLPGKVLICQLSAYARIHHRATGSIRENMA
ncbi:MAG: hypothetical protein GTN80_01385, partial [Nitrososphaeria archaeon]|nr:hypothetical protein [Nitrososphaeria archaeon]NIQ32295.1 hypothetical protein [Nitrososphaeria archaeon]